MTIRVEKKDRFEIILKDREKGTKTSWTVKEKDLMIEVDPGISNYGEKERPVVMAIKMSNPTRKKNGK